MAIIKAIIIEETEEGYAIVRFSPNPQKSKVVTPADSIHYMLFEHAQEIFKKATEAHGEKVGFCVVTDD